MILGAATLAVLALTTAPAQASEVRVEKKLIQFGGPETRTRCIKEWKTNGIPQCRVKNWTLKCTPTWMKGCSEWATDFYQHEFFLVASGPNVEEALRRYAENALERSLAAALIAAVATPGEVSAKAAAAYTAFKIALAAEIAAEPLLNALSDEFSISVEERGHW
jgi:hypothetical protein